MKISVIIPCHNAGPWVGEALRSVAAQTYPAHEIIVVDDGSTDNSVEEIQRSGVEVSLVARRFGNAALARNAGIEVAQGDWCAFLDADSMWCPYHLTQAVDLLDGGADSAYMVWQSGGLDSEDSSTVPVRAPVTAPVVGLNADDFLAWRYEHSYGFPTVGLVARTDALREVGGFDGTQRRRHDMDLFMRLVARRTWAFHPNPSWTTKPCAPGDISGNRASCQYFILRSYLRNVESFESPVMGKLVKQQARKATVEAIRSRQWRQMVETHRLASEHMSFSDSVRALLAGVLPTTMISAAKRIPEFFGAAR
jgi:glycosyltransferase involved in cell wall biosynthesis